ncbi:MAG: pilus assembly protein CpaB [Ruminiclostridium sp.]|nr:pilus assembly protein CpaB [Ruminiclostridium sp.]
MKLFKNRTVLGVLCIAIALVICFVITPLFNASAANLTTIVRIKNDIKVGTEITSKDIETVEIGAYNLPSNVVRKPDDVVGKYAAVELLKDEYVLSTKISDTPATENVYLYGMNGSKRVMSVTLPSFAKGLSGKLMSGDIVSVIAVDYQEKGETVVPDELQYVHVVAATDKRGNDEKVTEYRADGEEETDLPETVTLMVSPSQAIVLAELEAEGEIHIALVYRGTQENADKFLEAQEKILKDKADVTVTEKPAESETDVKPETTAELFGGEPDITDEAEETETTVELDIPDLAPEDESEGSEETVITDENAEVTDNGIISE